MSKLRALERKYARPIPQGNFVTHITTPDTFRTIKETNAPSTTEPTLLAVRQSRSKGGPLGVNLACNGGPFIYTFNCSAEYFTSTRAGQLTVAGIREKAGTNALTLLELDVGDQYDIRKEVPRFLPLQLESARRLIALLEQSDMGLFLKQTFLAAIAGMSPERLSLLQTKWDAARMYRAIVTSTAYAVGSVTNFALYGPSFAKHLFFKDPANIRIAGHAYISGMIHEQHLTDVGSAKSYFETVVAAYADAEQVENVTEVSLAEVHDALAEFFDPSYYGLTHASLEMFLDLNFKSFYWLLSLLKEDDNFSQNLIEQMQLFIHSLYHYLLVENIYFRHISFARPDTQFFRTYEPNGTTENFSIISPGKNAVFTGKVLQLSNNQLRELGESNFRLAHDYPLPVTQTTLPGLEQLGLANQMRNMQEELVQEGYILPNRRL